MLWHSHSYEVASGLLTAPHLPTVAENAIMKDLASTYGKTWHTWQVDRDTLPLGAPTLMMGFTADGQIDPKLVAYRDSYYGVDAAKIRAARKDIPTTKRASRHRCQ
jgi:hypothetical protein